MPHSVSVLADHVYDRQIVSNGYDLYCAELETAGAVGNARFEPSTIAIARVRPALGNGEHKPAAPCTRVVADMRDHARRGGFGRVGRVANEVTDHSPPAAGSATHVLGGARGDAISVGATSGQPSQPLRSQSQTRGYTSQLPQAKLPSGCSLPHW